MERLDAVVHGWIEAKLERVEARWGVAAGAIVVGAALLLGAAFYTTPAVEPRFLGVWFSQLSAAPFDFGQSNPLHFRLLGPLLGYVVGLRGDLFVFLPILFDFALLALAYAICRSRGLGPGDSFLMASLLAFSCVIFLPLASPAYTDSVSYFFILLAFGLPRRAYVSVAAFALALLNHEANVALLPALALLIGYEHSERWHRPYVVAIALTLASLLPLVVMREVIGMRVEAVYGAGDYLSLAYIVFNLQQIAYLAPLGAFFAFKLFWYYPLHLVLNPKSVRRPQLLVLLAIFAGVTSQLLVAFDVTRLFVLGFPGIWLAALWWRRERGEARFRHLTWRLVAYNFLVAQYYVALEGPVFLEPLPVRGGVALFELIT